jgi:di/tricarboxylate transporter
MMSEEERKEKPNHTTNFQGCKTRDFTVVALIAGIVTFLSGFLYIPAIVWITSTGFTFTYSHRHDMIWVLLNTVVIFTIYFFQFSFLLSLPLSIAAFFTETNKYLRLLPLAFVVIGACFCSLGYYFTD